MTTVLKSQAVSSPTFASGTSAVVTAPPTTTSTSAAVRSTKSSTGTSSQKHAPLITSNVNRGIKKTLLDKLKQQGHGPELIPPSLKRKQEVDRDNPTDTQKQKISDALTDPYDRWYNSQSSERQQHVNQIDSLLKRNFGKDTREWLQGHESTAAILKFLGINDNLNQERTQIQNRIDTEIAAAKQENRPVNPDVYKDSWKLTTGPSSQDFLEMVLNVPGQFINIPSHIAGHAKLWGGVLGNADPLLANRIFPGQHKDSSFTVDQAMDIAHHADPNWIATLGSDIVSVGLGVKGIETATEEFHAQVQDRIDNVNVTRQRILAEDPVYQQYQKNVNRNLDAISNMGMYDSKESLFHQEAADQWGQLLASSEPEIEVFNGPQLKVQEEVRLANLEMDQWEHDLRVSNEWKAGNRVSYNKAEVQRIRDHTTPLIPRDPYMRDIFPLKEDAKPTVASRSIPANEESPFTDYIRRKTYIGRWMTGNLKKDE